MAEEFIKKYEAARRDLIRLWKAKQSLRLAAQSRFPKSYPVYKSIERLCHNDPTCQIRFLADKAACRCADRYGDEMFRRGVDGVRIPAVTHWYYGISDLLPSERLRLDRTKTLNVSEIHLLERVGTLARAFHTTVSALPFVSAKDLSREAKRFEQAFAKAQVRVRECSPLYIIYSCLADRLPSGILDKVIAFSE